VTGNRHVKQHFDLPETRSWVVTGGALPRRAEDVREAAVIQR